MSAQPKRSRPGYGEGRQALVEAAIRVVGRAGLRGLTHRAVAAEAGVTQGLVAHHFGGRPELLRAALQEAFSRSIERSSLDPPSGRLEDFAGDLSTRADEAADEEAFQFEVALEARRHAELRADTRALYDAYHDATADALAHVGLPSDDPDLVRAVFAALDGLVFQQLLYGEPERTDRALCVLRDMVRAYADSRAPRTPGGHG
jgi:AcrR family transcriptional regulator